MSNTITISIESESGGYFVKAYCQRWGTRCPTYGTVTLEEATLLQEDIVNILNHLHSLHNDKK